ncbi:MAG: 2-oxo-4-hydroxy-4-carboxy-5-ureidoimidazoline decarboxylase [Ginsengibacter sp.]
MTISEFDNLEIAVKKNLLFNCCGSNAWVKDMLEIMPVNDLVDLLEYAEEKWYDCNPADWLEAFEHHPKIGDFHSMIHTFTNITEWTSGEQAGVQNSTPEMMDKLKKANEEYEETFGYIFIVFATGKSAKEMLEILHQRINNSPQDELTIAAAEQNRITQLRLQKLFA